VTKTFVIDGHEVTWDDLSKESLVVLGWARDAHSYALRAAASGELLEVGFLSLGNEDTVGLAAVPYDRTPAPCMEETALRMMREVPELEPPPRNRAERRRRERDRRLYR